MSPNAELGAGDGALHVFARLAAEAPDRAFVVVDDQALSRGEFVEEVARWSGALLRQGIGAGARIALITPNCLDWCVAFWAVVNLGAVPVPMDPQIGEWELERLFSLLDIQLCLVWSRFRSADTAGSLLRIRAQSNQPFRIVCLDRDLEGTLTRAAFLADGTPCTVPNRSVDPSDWLMLACTSGTTGNPKIIVVPHVGFVQSQLDMGKTLALGSADRLLLGMPLFHQGGFGMGLQALLAGGAATYVSRFEPEAFLRTIVERRITVVQLSATLAKLLLSHPRLDDFDLRGLRLAYFAGEVLPDSVAAEFWQKRQIRVVNVIGSSETATMVLWDSDRDHERSASEYAPLTFTDIHVGPWGGSVATSQPGSLWVSSDALLLAYYANPEETSRRLQHRDGKRWFDTEDLVLTLPDGYVRFVGRIKRAIKRGPNLVHPEELESFLLTNSEVAAVAVVREDHELYGDSIVAWVQPAPGARLTRGNLLAYCRGKISAYKIPDRFEIVEQLPVDIGKIQYKSIRANRNRTMTTPQTLNQHFEAALARFAPDRIAFGVEERAVTFAELSSGVDRMTASLHREGVGTGSIVGYSLPNCAEVITLVFAISRLGACAVPLFPMMPEPTRAGIFTALGCSLVIATGPSVAGLAQAAERMGSNLRVVELTTLVENQAAADGVALSRNDVAASDPPSRPLLAAASSGTTGAPKSVWMTQANAAAVLTATADLAKLGDWQEEPDYTSMAAFPVSTSSVLVLLGMILAGARMVFSRDMSPVRFLQLADHWKAEALSAPPSYFETILNLPPQLQPPLPALRAVFSGMDFLHTSLLMRLAERFRGLDRAASGYGLVETSTVFMTWKAHDRSAFERGAGVFTLCPGIGNTIDVRDEGGTSLPSSERGELWVKGPSVVSGYLGRSEETAAAFVDGWFRTGDVATRLDEKTIELHGRQKYLIKRAGKSVAPTEVQEKLDACPGVRQSAVVGVKHPLYGEMIWAFIVGTAAQPATLKDVMKACRATLPNYMVPDQVMFVAELPRGAGVGKLDREALIRMAEAELSRMQGETHG